MARLRDMVPLRAPATAVDLSPGQQIALLALRRHGPQPFAALARHIEAQRFYAPPADLANGILTLEHAGLIERQTRTLTPQSERRYGLTRRGRRALRGIPSDPRTILQVWV